MTEQRFNDERVRELVGRAIEIDSDEADGIPESDLLRIAEDVGVSRMAIDRALHELEGDVRAHPPPLASAFRRWGFAGVAGTLAAATAITAPEILAEVRVPFAILLVLSAFSALAPKYVRRRRERTILGVDGVRWTTAAGERRLPWSSVVELKTNLPGTLQIVGASGSVLLNLQDFGDPDSVVAAIRLRIDQSTRSDSGHVDR